MSNLEKYYPGDDDWNEYVIHFNDDWNESDIQLRLLNKLGNQQDLAKVISGKVGAEALNWVSKNIPALDGLTPIECLADDALVKRLKTALMRMP